MAGNKLLSRKLRNKGKSTKPNFSSEPLEERSISQTNRIKPQHNYRTRWSEMSDDELVEFAKWYIYHNQIEGKKELSKRYNGLYRELSKRGLLEGVGLPKRKKRWGKWERMSDEELAEYGMEIIKRENISSRTELARKHQNIYVVLRKRGLLNRLGLKPKKKGQYKMIWKDMSDEEVIKFARVFIAENDIKGRFELRLKYQGLYRELKKRNLMEQVGLDDFHKRIREETITNKALVELTRKLIREEKIISEEELEERHPNLYKMLRERDLLKKTRVEKSRNWKDMSDEEVVEFAFKYNEMNGIKTRYELFNDYCGLYQVLRRRNLLDRVFPKEA